jgi:glycosyltransferase involved in cell wall biosynthesis/tetratricopeptide (TPR) repeat protein
MSSKAPVSMCVIVRGEPLLEQALLSVRPWVEEIVVVVTSAKDTASIETARRIADVVEVHEECNRLDGVMTDEIWDFSIARNRSFDLARQPWILWMDADDVVDGLDKLPEVLRVAEAGRQNGTLEVCVHFPYEYQYNERGECFVFQKRERLFSNFLPLNIGAAGDFRNCPIPSGPRCFRWMNEDHEVCLSVDPRAVVLPEMTEIVWKHRRHLSTKNFDGLRNLRILRKMIERRPDDLRTKYYLGSALADAGLIDESILVLSDYVSKANWDEEKTMACLRLVNLHIAKNSLDEAVAWGLRIVATYENWAEGYLALCKTFYLLAQQGGPNEQRNWQRCAHFGKIAVKLPPTKTLLFTDPTESKYQVHQYLNMACNKIGDISGALESAEAGLRSNPADGNLQLNRYVYEEYLAKIAAKEALSKMKTASLELRKRYNMTRAGEEAFALLERAVEDPSVLEKDRVFPLPACVNGGRPTPDVHLGSEVFKPGELQTYAAVAARLVNQPEPVVVPAGSGAAGGKVNVGKTEILWDSNPSRRSLDIVFLCGPGWEIWNPEVLRTSGLGGSETAVIEMSKRLAVKGHRVRVYAGCGESKTYDGVEWVNSDWQPAYGKCDVCVVWRNAPMLELPGEAAVKLLWVHDVWAVGATRDNLSKSTRVLALSEWHRQFMAEHHAQHGLTIDKIVKTRNGIDLEKFVNVSHQWSLARSLGSVCSVCGREASATRTDQACIPRRDPHKVVYSSSADRGLESLLQMWPRIRSAVKDATLHIFYGFYNWEQMSNTDPVATARINAIKSRIFDLQPQGVVYRGRVDQQTLAREMLSAGAMLYPTWFSETFGISCVEAMAAGLRIVTSPIAATKEYVGSRGVMIEGDWLSPEYQNKFVDAAVWALNNGGNREALQQYAREHFSWDGVADEWEVMMQELLGDSGVAFRIEPEPEMVVAKWPEGSVPLKWTPGAKPVQPVSVSDPNAYEGIL